MNMKNGLPTAIYAGPKSFYEVRRDDVWHPDHGHGVAVEYGEYETRLPIVVQYFGGEPPDMDALSSMVRREYFGSRVA